MHSHALFSVRVTFVTLLTELSRHFEIQVSCEKEVLEMSSNKLQKGELNKYRSCIQNIQNRGFLFYIADLLAGGCWIRPLALFFYSLNLSGLSG